MLAGLTTPAVAQAVGSEFQVNTYTTSHQRMLSAGDRHLVAADASGNFVVVWRSLFQDGSVYGIFGQRYDSAGVALGSEFRVNSYTTATQQAPSIASDANGNFVVVWSSPDGSELGIFGQRYDSAGGALGTEFRVNSYTTTWQNYASVASDASGNFVVVWSGVQDATGYSVFGRRFDSGGAPQGAEFRVNSYTPGTQRFPSLVSDADGDIIVVWSSDGQDGSDYGIFAQRYDSGGAPRGGEFRVNSYTTGDQRRASVASDANGNFVVAWSSWPGQDGGDSGIFGQRYDSDGAAQGGEFRVNSYTTDDQDHASVASEANGNFVVVWHSYFQEGGSWGVFGQRYDSAGVAQGAEFQINSFTTYFQAFPTVAPTGTNQFVVAWESYGQDRSGTGIFGQRYDFGGLPSLSIANVSVREGNPSGDSKRTSARFTVTLSAPNSQTVTVQYATADGTATAPSDYKATSGTLTLNPGQTSGSIVIAVRKDTVPESDETFFVNLSNPTNATIADGQAVGTIRNDDQLARATR